MSKKENRKKKKVLKKFLEGLDMKAELNSSPGRLLRGKSPKQNKKARRHSGRKTPKLPKPSMKYDEMKQQALEPQEYWDDWLDYRDGFREVIWNSSKEEQKYFEEQLKKHIAIRKARRQSKNY